MFCDQAGKTRHADLPRWNPMLQANFCRNYGIIHLLVGRAHAGVGDFYGMFEAQEIFRKMPTPADSGKRLLCEPLNIDWTFYCKKCDGMASMRTCPHGKEDRVILSGTKLRKMLSEDAIVPAPPLAEKKRSPSCANLLHLPAESL